MLVPIKEMTDVLSVESKVVDLAIDAWVRMKLGIYKGDLAKVLFSDFFFCFFSYSFLWLCSCFFDLTLSDVWYRWLMLIMYAKGLLSSSSLGLTCK